MRYPKVCILCHNPSRETGRGMDRYAYELIRNLCQLNYPFNVIYQRPIYTHYDWLIGELSYPICLMGKKADIYHATTPITAKTAILLGKSPLIVSLLDVFPYIYPNIPGKIEVFRYMRLCIRVASKSQYFITMSNINKQHIINILNIPEDIISVIYLGVDHNTFRPIPKLLYRKNERKEKIIFYLG